MADAPWEEFKADSGKPWQSFTTPRTSAVTGPSAREAWERARSEGTRPAGTELFGAVFEPLATMASSMVAKPVHDAAALGLAVPYARARFFSGEQGSPENREAVASLDQDMRDLAQMQQSMTYTPRTSAGASSYNPLNAIPRGIGAFVDYIRPGEAEDPSTVMGMAQNAVREAIPQGLGLLGMKYGNNLIPKVNVSPDVLKLRAAGVSPTIGQTLGGTWARLESAAESIPFIGEGIRNAKARAFEDFNRSVLNQSLKPIGAAVDDVGHAGMAQARNFVSKAYDDAIDLVPVVDLNIGGGFTSAINNIRSMGRTLKQDYANQLASVMDRDLFSRVGRFGRVTGETAKRIQSDFSRRAAQFRKSTSPDDWQMADAFDAVSQALRDQIGINSPEAAAALRLADSSHAMLLRAEKAAQMQGAPNGIFTPAQFGNAVRSTDSSLRHGAVGRGEALMQDMSTAGRNVLGEKMPNSGSAERFIGAEAIMGAGTAAGLLSNLFTHPIGTLGTAAGLGLGRGLYAAPVQKAITSYLTSPRSATLGNMAKAPVVLGPLNALSQQPQDTP